MTLSAMRQGDWDKRWLDALRRSRPDHDEPPQWRAALRLYDGLSHIERAKLDSAVIAMIDADYRNPAAASAEQPFEAVLTPLPAGLRADDLLCIEAAVMVAAERKIGDAFFAFNRLMRHPRWHALYPRLIWLNYEAQAAQRKLAQSLAGRRFGTLLGLAVGDSLGAMVKGKSKAQIRTLYPGGHRELDGAGRAYEPLTAYLLGIGPKEDVNSDPELDAAIGAYHCIVDRLVTGEGTKEEAYQAAAGEAGLLSLRLSGLLEQPFKSLRSNGCVVDALEAAICSFLQSNDLEECIVRAVNLGGDTAAVGAVAGWLAGSFYGPLAVPRRWTAMLKGREKLAEIAARRYCTPTA